MAASRSESAVCEKAEKGSRESTQRTHRTKTPALNIQRSSNNQFSGFLMASQRKDFVEFLRDLFEVIGRFDIRRFPRRLSSAPTLITDFVERLHDAGPVVVAF